MKIQYAALFRGIVLAVFSLGTASCVDSSIGTRAMSPNASLSSVSGTDLVLKSDLQQVSYLPPPPNTNQGADQLIAIDDVLEIDVFQVDDLDRIVKVDPRGTISLALVNSMIAADKTVSQLQADIASAYGARYLQNPQVTVFIKDSAGQLVTVEGAVSKPGIYPIASSATLLQVVAQAGGLQDIADNSKIYVYRQYGDKKAVANFDVRSIRSGKKKDPRIYGGDLIISFQSDSKVALKNLKEALSVASSAARLATPF